MKQISLGSQNVEMFHEFYENWKNNTVFVSHFQFRDDFIKDLFETINVEIQKLETVNDFDKLKDKINLEVPRRETVLVFHEEDLDFAMRDEYVMFFGDVAELYVKNLTILILLKRNTNLDEIKLSYPYMVSFDRHVTNYNYLYCKFKCFYLSRIECRHCPLVIHVVRFKKGAINKYSMLYYHPLINDKLIKSFFDSFMKIYSKLEKMI